MDLKTFVKETLTQIAEGVNESKAALNKNGMKVAVHADAVGVNIPKTRTRDGQNFVSIVNFETVLDVGTAENKTNNIGVVSSLLSLGRQKGKQETSSDVTRVSFSVPLSFLQE